MRNSIILVIIIAIAAFTAGLYFSKEAPKGTVSREQISLALKNTYQGKEHPVYRYINTPVFWYGTLIRYKVAPKNQVKLYLKVKDGPAGIPDTILVTKIKDPFEYFQIYHNKIIWFKGLILRIDPDQTGNEMVFVRGYTVE
jgi:hypothetical protein